MATVSGYLTHHASHGPPPHKGWAPLKAAVVFLPEGTAIGAGGVCGALAVDVAFQMPTLDPMNAHRFIVDLRGLRNFPVEGRRPWAWRRRRPGLGLCRCGDGTDAS